MRSSSPCPAPASHHHDDTQVSNDDELPSQAPHFPQALAPTERSVNNAGLSPARACAQVVDGLFIRLPSRPLGVVRIRWGICRRGWCGCWVIAQGHGRVAAEVIDGPRVENSRIRRHNTPPPTADYEAPPFLPSSRMQRPGLFGLRDVHRWNLRGLPIQPLLSIALVLHAHRPAAPRWGGGPGQRAALTSRLNGRTRRHGHSRHASTGTLAATGTHVTPQRAHSPHWIVTDTSCVAPSRSIVMVTVSPAR